MKRKIILSISFLSLLFTAFVYDYDNAYASQLKSPDELVVGYHGKEYTDDAVYKINKHRKDENDFLFCLGNVNTMLYIKDVKNNRNEIVIIELYIENKTNKKILATTNLIYQNNLNDTTGTMLENNNSNKFEINENETTAQTISFKIPKDIDFENLRINIVSETLDGEPLVDVTGQLNFIEKY